MHKKLYSPSFAKFLGISGLTLLLGACSSSHLLVKKTDLAAAEQCLQTQQKLVASNVTQQEQIAEALSLLQQSVVLQQERDELLRELASRPLFQEQRQQACPPVSPMAASGETELDKQIVGAHEKVRLVDANLVMPASIDTGSSISVLDARDLEPFERNSEQWVRFNLIDPETGAAIEREHRRLNKPQGNGDEAERRPVIELRVTLGDITQVAEFALAERSKQQYPLVIGRNVLRDLMLVDVGRSNITEPKPSEADNSRERN